MLLQLGGRALLGVEYVASEEDENVTPTPVVGEKRLGEEGEREGSGRHVTKNGLGHVLAVCCVCCSFHAFSHQGWAATVRTGL